MTHNQWPLITIAIPVYNHQAFIVECLQSVLQDDYPAKEIIIIDDGSSDHSAEIIFQFLESLSKPELKMITFIKQSNQGVCAVMNRIVAQANGELIRPLAGDDKLLPRMLKQHVACLMSDPEKLAAFADAQAINNAGEVIARSVLKGYIGHDTSRFSEAAYLKRLLITQGKLIPNVVVRKSFYEKFSYPLGSYTEDYSFFLTLAAANQLIYFDAIVSEYRIHADNSSKSFSWQESPQRLKKRYRLIQSEINSLKSVLHLYFGMDRVMLVYSCIKKRCKLLVLTFLLAINFR